MDPTLNARIILVTAPNLETATSLAKAALQDHLVACANLIPGVISHYWWKDQLEQSNEVQIVFKTTAENTEPLERLILEKHPYDTPEILSISPEAGNQRYLEWLGQSTNQGSKGERV